MNKNTKTPAHKTNKMKLMLTATMCAVLLFGAAACNNGNGNDVNVDANVNDANNNAPAVTDDAVVPTEPAANGGNAAE
ncbi:MAG: hypothetical protein K0Q63_3780 [Paenibacillus sp.]|nr:hypothetical protein [Paenibacillus sp.]